MKEGEYNRDRMKKVFDADHLMISPSQDSLIKLNRLGFNKVGDMNWHNHCTEYSVLHSNMLQSLKYHI